MARARSAAYRTEQGRARLWYGRKKGDGGRAQNRRKACPWSIPPLLAAALVGGRAGGVGAGSAWLCVANQSGSDLADLSEQKPCRIRALPLKRCNTANRE